MIKSFKHKGLKKFFRTGDASGIPATHSKSGTRLEFSDGLFETRNTAANLKGDMFDALVANHLNILSWFPDDYLKHNHGGIIPSSPPR